MSLSVIFTPPANNGLTRVLNVIVSVVALITMALPVASTVVRRFSHADLPLATVLVQHLTLWLGFIGALLTTHVERHLQLSTSEATPVRLRPAASFLRQAVSTTVTALLASAATIMVRADLQSDRELFWGIPVAASEAIMPIAFGLMSLRFAWSSPGTRWRNRIGSVVLAALVFLAGVAGPSTLLAVILAVVLGVAFLSGAPIFIAMGGAAMLLFWLEGVPLAAVPAEAFRLATSPSLPAIPLLTIAGFVLTEGNASKRLMEAYRGVFGWLPGGIAIMTVVICTVFTAFTGGSGVTILACGGLLYPMLRSEGYPNSFSLGLVTASSSLGLLFPPSLPVLLYSVVAEVPMEHLYVGGFLPGMLMMGAVIGYSVWTGVRLKLPRSPFVPRTALKGLWAAKWDIGLPVVIIGSVASGFATVVEASALGCLYAIFLEFVLYRTLNPVRDLTRVLGSAVTLVGAVLILLGVALGLSSYLVDAEIPTRLLAWVTTHIKSPWLFLLALNGGLLILGSVLEIYASIIVLAPLIAPIGVAYGISPIHLGVVFLANLELGFLFPPMGMNLFLSSTRFERPLLRVAAATAPFLLIIGVGVLLITYIEPLTTFPLAFLKSHSGG